MSDLPQLIKDAGPELGLAIGVAVFVIYPAICYVVSRRDLDRIGREFCVRHGYTYIGIKHAKSHMSVVYRTGGKKCHAKFVVHEALFGKVRNVHWLT